MMSGLRETTISALTGTQITRHYGRPTRQAVKQTRRELGIIYAAAKTNHAEFQMGQRFGYAAAILTSKQFIASYNRVCAVDDELNEDWEFLIPQPPATTNPDIIDTTTDTMRRKMVAEWNEQVKQYERFDAYEHVFKEKLEAAYDSQYFDTLKDDLLGFTHVCVSEMLDHLTQQSLALTDVEKQERLQAAQLPWNQDDAIDTFYHILDKQQEELSTDDIEWTNSQKISHTMNEMYRSNIFDARDMREWERKPANNKTWLNLRSYFGELYVDSKRYDKATGSRHGFESAANIEEKKATEENDKHFEQQLSDIAIAATADKEHIQQMTNSTEDLLKIIKEQQSQIKELMRQNGMLIAKVGTTNPPPNNPPPNNPPPWSAIPPPNNPPPKPPPYKARPVRKPFHQQGYVYTPAEKAAARILITAINAGTKEASTFGNCMICNKHSQTARCHEIERNGASRREGWKSHFA